MVVEAEAKCIPVIEVVLSREHVAVSSQYLLLMKVHLLAIGDPKLLLTRIMAIFIRLGIGIPKELLRQLFLHVLFLSALLLLVTLLLRLLLDLL